MNKNEVNSGRGNTKDSSNREDTVALVSPVTTTASTSRTITTDTATVANNAAPTVPVQLFRDAEAISVPDGGEGEEPPPRFEGASGNKRKSVIVFDADVERMLGDWYRENDFLYKKGHRDHFNRAKKHRVFEEKARSLNPPLTGRLYIYFEILVYILL